MSKIKYLVLIFFITTQSLYAQYAKFGIDAFAGVPVSLTFFTPSVSTYGGLGLRYSLLKEVSINGQFSIGSMTGKNNSVNAVLSAKDEDANYSNYSNNFYQYTGGLQINLEKVFNLRKVFHRFNPYLNLGGGIIHSSVTAERINGTQRQYNNINFYTGYIGIQIRYYMNPSLDLLVGSDLNFAQTRFNDAVPIDVSFDNYLLTHIGISYKVGARKDKQNIEWNNVILKDRIYIPNIEKHLGQPLDEAGNYFVFHKDSITKLQAQNIELQNKTSKLEAKNVAQQKQIDSLQSEQRVMKTSIDTLQNQINQIKDQMAKQPPVVYVPTPAPVVPVASGKKKTKIVKSSEKSNIEQSKENIAVEPTTNNTPSNSITDGLNKIDGTVTPLAKYNVIAGAYAGTKYAYIFRDKMRAKGYEAAVFKSDVNSKIYRVCLFTSEDKSEAMKMMKKIRAEFDAKAWVHVYNQK